MEIADVSWLAGGPVRVCTAADDAEAREREIRVLTVALAKEARAAAALAAEVMGADWGRPVQPVHVEPMAKQP